ncbi:hypothetical protein LEP1GSC008_1994 [Leptospira kirschneri serovar Bulgarica str. Nikolaevo]|uniref:Uncharacterized protein n=1 Tax=Leptospira kirschneri serovar Bulgarica str. Nikolaevo TaxID=1240687 RepID=M6F2F7_9LEPT|nr:hypothetical protein LEP1GSC008_1994 [Leptospira kirschneri serovar Bulgarica str. Nikolaevo]
MTPAKQQFHTEIESDDHFFEIHHSDIKIICELVLKLRNVRSPLEKIYF